MLFICLLQWYLWNYNIRFSWNKSFGTVYCKMSLYRPLVKKHLNSHKRVQISTDIIKGFLISTDMTMISTTKNLRYTELNTNRCSIPCASGRQTVAVHKAVSRQKAYPVKKIKRQIKCLSQTQATLLDPSEQINKKERRLCFCFLGHFWRPIQFKCERWTIAQSCLNGVPFKDIWTVLLLEYEYELKPWLWGQILTVSSHLNVFLCKKKKKIIL